jgi:hypothetical protein
MWRSRSGLIKPGTQHRLVLVIEEDGTSVLKEGE